MKWNRERAILEILRFTYELNLDRKRGNTSRVRIWERLRKHLFFDDPDKIIDRLDDLSEIQEALRDFLDQYLMPILNAYKLNPWKDLNEIATASKENPVLYDIYVKGKWKSLPLPSTEPETILQRVFFCDGEFIHFNEHYRSVKDHAVQNTIKLFAMDPPLPISKFYQCQLDECSKWAINNRKSRKHWFCSTKCYNRDFKRQERSTPEGKALNRKRSSAHYYKKTVGYIPKHLK